MKGISSRVTRAIPSMGTMLCVDNSGAKVVQLITVLRKGSVHRRYPAGGVGDLIQMASSRGKKQNKNIKLGICGEHGGDPKSIEFCARTGLDYVSCSPFRVPVARLAAAQAELTK